MKVINFILFTVLAICQAQAQFVLTYDEPAAKFTEAQRKDYRKAGFMQEALPLGNGRLGAMFSGGIDEEYIMLNDITLWMNAKRGLDEVAQSGTRIGAYKNFEKVREAYRNENYGTGENSMETMSTKYLSTQQPLGNYAPFTDVYISTGHYPEEVSNYTRSLDAFNGVGRVKYAIGEAHFTREYFCSYPNDVVMMRYTSENAEMNLTVKASTLHKIISLNAEGNTLILNGEVVMETDQIQFQKRVYVDAGKAKIKAQDDGSLSIENAKDVKIYVVGLHRLFAGLSRI